MTTKKATTQPKEITHFQFPPVDREIFDQNYLETVVIELRYPTYLRLREKEPLEISEAIRAKFPIYDLGRRMDVTPLGTTDSQPVYTFTPRQKDPVFELSTSKILLTTKKYKSFDNFSAHIEFIVEQCLPYLDTTFFTRVGLRYINAVSGIHETGSDILDWITNDLVKPVAGGEVGSVYSMKSELTGPLREGGSYTFRYGLPPASPGMRKFVLDWDYYKENVEVGDCMDVLKAFHRVHFPFFWWALGGKAREALKNGTVY